MTRKKATLYETMSDHMREGSLDRRISEVMNEDDDYLANDDAWTGFSTYNVFTSAQAEDVSFINPHQPGIVLIDGSVGPSRYGQNRISPNHYDPIVLEDAVMACWRVLIITTPAQERRLPERDLIRITQAASRPIGIIATTKDLYAEWAAYLEERHRMYVVHG